MAASDEDVAEVGLGSILLSLMDPTPGHEVEFHRWYERDHFYAGCMVGPWFFSGRRYVATGALKDLRYPDASAVAQDVRRGSYLALYWIVEGHHAEAEAWSVRQVQRLIAQGRMLETRRPVQAGFHLHRWSTTRDADGVPPELALEHPFAGVALLVIERAPDAKREALDRWLRETWLAGTLPGSDVALCLAFDPVPLPDDAPAYVERPEGLDRRTLLLAFLDGDPQAGWDRFAKLGSALEATGLGSVGFAAPFVPTIPGSDRYADELW